MFLRWKQRQVSRAKDACSGCEHPTPVLRLTPQVLEAYRDDGKTKHQHIWTGPSFRMCCLHIPQERVGWWHHVVTQLGHRFGNWVTTDEWRRILDKMGETIPRMTADEHAIYLQGYIGHMFPCRHRNDRETYDEHKLKIWGQATLNWRMQRPKPKAERVRFGEPFPAQTTTTDPRSVLGLGEMFTQVELKAAFREAVKRNHPDHGGTVEGFHAVHAAYTALRQS